MENILDWDFFCKRLSKGVFMNEVCFYFADDPNEEKHYIGCMVGSVKPYWIGGCDEPDGTEYYTVKELVNDKIFNGRSLKERWNEVKICNIDGICLKNWLNSTK